MANLQEMGLLVPQKAVGSGIGKRPTHSSRRALRHDLKCGRPARDGIGGTAVSLLLQVEAQCVVELGHHICWGRPEDRAQPLDCDGADLLGLGLGVLTRAGRGQ